MTSVLSLPLSTNSLLIAGRDDAFGRSCASAASIETAGTVQYHRISRLSNNSISSGDSIFSHTLRWHSEDKPTFPESCLKHLSGPNRLPANDNLSNLDNTPVSFSVNHGPVAEEPFRLGECSNHGEPMSPSIAGGKIETGNALGEEMEEEDSGLSDQHSEVSNVDVEGHQTPFPVKHPQAFRRWISKLRKRHHSHQQSIQADTSTTGEGRWVWSDLEYKAKSPTRSCRQPSHRKSDSQASSLGFVQAVKSATETLASASIATISRRNPKWRSDARRSSVVSGSEARTSIESQPSFIDEAARQRSRRRRQKLEELICTEESYVADIKALSNAYFTVIAHHSTPVSFVRSSAQRTLVEILHLHDDILGHLHRIVPFAEYDQCIANTNDSTHHRAHVRWHSVDVVPCRQTPAQAVIASLRQGRRSLNLGRPSEEDNPALHCSPHTIASVAKMFSEQIRRLKVYEEYGVNFDLVQRDIDEIQQSLPAWHEFDRAIEVLSVHVNPIRRQAANSKRAMTIKDLLIKPIQRLPRYELLFSDLCKLTPVYDDPEAHTALTEVLVQLNETCRRMNEAKDNPHRARMLETSFLIQDRLSFSSQIPRAIFSQLLGPVQLCGCLYIAYRGRERIKGCYVICVLFQSTLLLANVEGELQKYNTIAGIGLATATIEETDNSKGIQCHTVPHAWKVVFEHSARMYELVFVACSTVEADVWRRYISDGIQTQSHAVANGLANSFELQSPLTEEMRSIGKAFGKPGSFVRRMSVHRTATVGPTTDLNQIIIKNTQAVKEVQDNSSQHSLSIARSQSLATPSHVQTLAPRRADRYRLEAVLADVWTRNLLPYPSMVRRIDPLRASANNVIRKFSMASITSNFSSSKRSTSYTSMSSWRKEEASLSKTKRFEDVHQNAGDQERPPLVDFHNAPEAFLPADFELQTPPIKHKKSAIRTLTMMERPFSPLHGSENVASNLRRAQSVRDGMKSMLSPRASPKAAKVAVPRAGGPAPDGSNRQFVTFSHDGNAQAGVASVKSPKKSKSKYRLLRLFNNDGRQ